VVVAKVVNENYAGLDRATPALVARTTDIQFSAFLRVDELLTPAIPPFYYARAAGPADVGVNLKYQAVSIFSYCLRPRKRKHLAPS
jgi:hypothetical protein